MPHPDDTRSEEVRSELTDILVQVVDCAPTDVVDRAKLKDLGVDSLAIVEMADELGRRFDVYLPDESVNELRTVADAVAAVALHDGIRSPRSTTYAAASPAASSLDDLPPPEPEPTPAAEVDPGERRSAFRRMAFWFAAIGAAVGIVFGLGSAALIGVTGLGDTTLPPLALPSTPAPTTPTPTPTPTQTPDPEQTADPDPTLTIPNTQVPPGERFTLEGAFPGLDKGETLQVQVKDPGESWDEFPVTTKTRDGGAFKTQIYTSRTGERQFRLTHVQSEKTTPAVKVTIG
ncbi:acyl carrier protein [Aeromicrobium sp.]|uniref:acyl carrier protein n=1 Tax=Aeromicrobium sp. TaxID=1871063 RepID=UPI003C5BEBB5